MGGVGREDEISLGVERNVRNSARRSKRRGLRIEGVKVGELDWCCRIGNVENSYAMPIVGKVGSGSVHRDVVACLAVRRFVLALYREELRRAGGDIDDFEPRLKAELVVVKRVGSSADFENARVVAVVGTTGIEPGAVNGWRAWGRNVSTQMRQSLVLF